MRRPAGVVAAVAAGSRGLFDPPVLPRMTFGRWEGTLSSVVAGAGGTWTCRRWNAHGGHSEGSRGSLSASDDNSHRLRRLTWSQLRADGNNTHLPWLPVPELADTLARYERSLLGFDLCPSAASPVAVPDDHVDAMRQFLLGPTGQRLQQHLVDRSREQQRRPATAHYPNTFIEKEWDGMYLCHRGPAAPMMVPAIALPRSAAPAETQQCADQQCHTAARWVHGLLRFAHKLVHEGMDVDAARPFDFHAMTKQFGFARIPTKAEADATANGSVALNVSSAAASQGVRDELALAPLEGVAMGHIVVLHKGFIYRVGTRSTTASADGGGEGGVAAHCYASPEELAESFASIVAGRDEAEGHLVREQFPVGALTGVNRDTWARVREDLALDPSNAAVLRVVDEAFIVVCLDTSTWDRAGPCSDGPCEEGRRNSTNNDDGILRGMLGGVDHDGGGHGGGVDVVSRWYDKHMLLVDGSGRAAFCFEHSFSDGMVWSRWIDEVFQHLAATGTVGGEASAAAYTPLPLLPSTESKVSTSVVSRLDFNLSDEDKAEIVAAVDAVRDQVARIAHAAVTLPLGKSQIAAELRVSPDAFCQAAFLLAYHRRHGGEMAATYESCSTGGFYHGRTETIRTTTAEMRALCRAFSDDGASRPRRLELLREASKRHVALAKEANSGKGIDRHLLALKLASQEQQQLLDEESTEEARRVFSDPVFVHSSERWMMTTSNLSKPFVDWFNFCPVQPDGYGVGYTIQPDAIRIAVSSYAASEVSNARGLADAVYAAAQDLADLRSSEV